MSVAVSCPRCGGSVREPDLMHSEWRCPRCGPVPPLHVPEHIGAQIVASVVDRVAAAAPPGGPATPVWCPWPLPPGWTLTGVAYAGDERGGVRATAVACAGPEPLGGGPADLLFVAEEPGVGLGTRLAGMPGPDPGPQLAEALTDPGPGHPEHVGQARIRVGGHPTPLWLVNSPTDRSAYAGEARGLWLHAIAWPASAGHLLAEDVELRDLTEWTPAELVYGAPSPYLHGGA
ncbi:TFIIB-type zinc ribbon-containing protein [Micromonospora olivasterospora]